MISSLLQQLTATPPLPDERPWFLLDNAASVKCNTTVPTEVTMENKISVRLLVRMADSASCLLLPARHWHHDPGIDEQPDTIIQNLLG